MKIADTQPKPIHVVFADDHEVVRSGLKAMLRREQTVSVVGTAANGRELVDLVAKLQPDVVFTDVKMPLMDGIEATAIISRNFPKVCVLALTMFEEVEVMTQMMNAGARGYLIKNACKEEIVQAAKTVFEKGVYFCNTTNLKMSQRNAQHLWNKEVRASFSETEISIIQLICRQYANKEIAHELHMSPRTVESYRDRILQKMDVKNMAGIVVYAIKNGIFVINEQRI